ncbi:hypothetical protein OG607_24485 [Streptomyces sp. NBC_01537]|uniref:hypothetical protein n=1 Tax=Streptomyces sp. NBC_01537 TaxID=2903896 RepID=UPI00386FD82A
MPALLCQLLKHAHEPVMPIGLFAATVEWKTRSLKVLCLSGLLVLTTIQSTQAL